MAIVLGVDIGTTSAKCLAVDEIGRVLGFAQEPYPMMQPHEGWSEQDPADYVRALGHVVVRCVDECRCAGRDARDIAALALSTQADTLVLADEDGVSLRPAITWMDARAEEEYRELLEDCGPSFWYGRLGQPLSAYSSACTLRWLGKHEPELMARRPRVSYVPDFVARRLTGRWATDVPNASWSPFLTPASRSRAADVMQALGVTDDQVPPALESGEPIGEILPELCSVLGLGEGTLLVAGAFDQTAAAYGAGAEAGGASVLSCGTAWVVYAVASSPPADADEGLCTCCHVRPDQWGIVLPYTGGSAYDWVQRTIVQGTQPSDSSPLVFVPHLYGGLSPDWRKESRGSLLGLTLSHTAEDIRLALMRGMAFETRRNLEAAVDHAGVTHRLLMVGGAAHSDIWPQMIADALDCTVEVGGVTEAACYGAARIAAGEAAAGWVASEPSRVCAPDRTGAGEMDRLYTTYCEAYARLIDHYGSIHPSETR